MVLVEHHLAGSRHDVRLCLGRSCVVVHRGSDGGLGGYAVGADRPARSSRLVVATGIVASLATVGRVTFVAHLLDDAAMWLVTLPSWWSGGRLVGDVV